MIRPGSAKKRKISPPGPDASHLAPHQSHSLIHAHKMRQSRQSKKSLVIQTPDAESRTPVV
jgi:hypothetical protein